MTCRRTATPPWEVTDNVVLHPWLAQELERYMVFAELTGLVALSDARVAIPNDYRPPAAFRRTQGAVRRRRLDAEMSA